MRFSSGMALGTAILTLLCVFGMGTVASASPPPPRGYLKTANGNYVAVRGAVRAGAKLEEVPDVASAAQWALTAKLVGILSTGLCMTIADHQVILGQCYSNRATVDVIAAGRMVKLYFVQARRYVTWQESGNLTASKSGTGSHADFIPPGSS